MKPEVFLKAFVLYRSENGFVELVAATVDEVYSIALSLVQGPPHLVEEAVLRVYWELARKARWLPAKTVLADWLRQQTCRAAVKILHEVDRPVDRAALRKEKRGPSSPGAQPTAPPGLATRVSQSILLNAARSKSVWTLLPRALWPAWVRPVHLGAGTACVLGLIALWNIPFHRGNPIVLSPESHLTPASFGQLGTSEEGGVAPPPGSIPTTNVQSNRKQP